MDRPQSSVQRRLRLATESLFRPKRARHQLERHHNQAISPPPAPSQTNSPERPQQPTCCGSVGHVAGLPQHLRSIGHVTATPAMLSKHRPQQRACRGSTDRVAGLLQHLRSTDHVVEALAAATSMSRKHDEAPAMLVLATAKYRLCC